MSRAFADTALFWKVLINIFCHLFVGQSVNPCDEKGAKLWVHVNFRDAAHTVLFPVRSHWDIAFRQRIHTVL